MGGHGGLNILPQKKWNIYNHDNREKIERDKALRAKQLKEQEMTKIKSNLKMNLMKLKKKKNQKNEAWTKKDTKFEFTEKRDSSLEKKAAIKTKIPEKTEPEQTFGEMTKKRKNRWYKKTYKEQMNNALLTLQGSFKKSHFDLNTTHFIKSDLKTKLKKQKQKIKKIKRSENKYTIEKLEKRQARREAKAQKQRRQMLI